MEEGKGKGGDKRSFAHVAVMLTFCKLTVVYDLLEVLFLGPGNNSNFDFQSQMWSFLSPKILPVLQHNQMQKHHQIRLKKGFLRSLFKQQPKPLIFL